MLLRFGLLGKILVRMGPKDRAGMDVQTNRSPCVPFGTTAQKVGEMKIADEMKIAGLQTKL